MPIGKLTAAALVANTALWGVPCGYVGNKWIAADADNAPENRTAFDPNFRSEDDRKLFKAHAINFGTTMLSTAVASGVGYAIGGEDQSQRNEVTFFGGLFLSELPTLGAYLAPGIAGIEYSSKSPMDNGPWVLAACGGVGAYLTAVSIGCCRDAPREGNADNGNDRGQVARQDPVPLDEIKL